jgi:hypothetical protein
MKVNHNSSTAVTKRILALVVLKSISKLSIGKLSPVSVSHEDVFGLGHVCWLDDYIHVAELSET